MTQTVKLVTAAQKQMAATIRFAVADIMKDTGGTERNFGADIFSGTRTFDMIALPRNSVVIGGRLLAATTFSGGSISALNVTVGDSSSASRYLASTDCKSGQVLLVPTGFKNVSALSLRVGITAVTGAPTAGELLLELEYIIEDRAEEVTSPAVSY